ncbi:DUF5131 family protein [Helicobacter sp. MIT 05-5294]|uniref:DUF5131 family protein n=1 Tax=Helicobacter sp. MIT 05-5294 TaxID=1548150 RepID=UPI001EE8D9CD|nr:DUF5131 family protein [Helicobacter sp. MIT 05-5294]
MQGVKVNLDSLVLPYFRELATKSIKVRDFTNSQDFKELKETNWNPWHGCVRVSEGCRNCFVYTIDSITQKDTRKLYQTRSFNLPIVKNRQGNYKIPSGTRIWTCFSSDFLLESADIWRAEAWEMIAQRRDCTFVFFTKRITRFLECVPKDWGEGYPNVIVGCSIENQTQANKRLGAFLELPIHTRWIICAPLLGQIDLTPFLDSRKIARISVGGESGLKARACDFAWVESLQFQAKLAGIAFDFHQTGANFIKDSKRYKIPKKIQRSQAKKAGLDWNPI